MTVSCEQFFKWQQRWRPTPSKFAATYVSECWEELTFLTRWCPQFKVHSEDYEPKKNHLRVSIEQGLNFLEKEPPINHRYTLNSNLKHPSVFTLGQNHCPHFFLQVNWYACLILPSLEFRATRLPAKQLSFAGLKSKIRCRVVQFIHFADGWGNSKLKWTTLHPILSSVFHGWWCS